eukprot:gene11013-18977_t
MLFGIKVIEMVRVASAAAAAAVATPYLPSMGKGSGCGSSKGDNIALAIPEHQRDPDDFTIEPMELVVCDIPEFDDTFNRIQENLNELINLNNTVNDGVAEVKAAFATVTGAYEVEVTIAPSTDRILIDMFSDEPGFPRPALNEVRKLITTPDIRQADIALERARGALHRYLAGCENQPFTLRAEGDNGSVIMVPSTSSSPDIPMLPEQLTAFNSALADFRQLLHGKFRVGVYVKPTAAFGTKMIYGRLLKHATDDVAPDDGHVYEPASLLDVCVTPEVAKIKESEAFLMDRAQQLALRTRTMTNPTWEIIADHRVNITTLIPDPELRSQVRKLLLGVNTALFKLLNAGTMCRVRKLLLGVNIALFKLLNAGTMCRGPSRMQDAVVEVARAVAQTIKDRHRYSNLPYPLKTLVTINPEVVFGDPDDESAPAFDFQFNVWLHDNAFIAPFPSCLPDDAQEVFNSLDFLKGQISEALTALPIISDSIDELLEQAKPLNPKLQTQTQTSKPRNFIDEFLGQAKAFYELAPEAAAARGMMMMEAAFYELAPEAAAACGMIMMEAAFYELAPEAAAACGMIMMEAAFYELAPEAAAACGMIMMEAAFYELAPEAAAACGMIMMEAAFYELAPEAAAARGMTMMEAVKSGKAVGSNLKMLFETNRLFVALGDNVKRVAADLALGRIPSIKLVEDELSK